MFSQDFRTELVEVGPGIILYGPDAHILSLIRNEDECPASAENFGDLVDLAFLLAEQDFVKAKKVADMIMHTREPMFMLPSSSMLESNDNYLKRNPFKR